VTFPYPPQHLRERVGGAFHNYDHVGAAARRDFLALLPADFDWNGVRALDFGAGAGRTLRQFAPEAEQAAEFWACDIDAESVEWMQANLCPPFRAFRNDALPPLPFEAGSLDVIYSMSVFTHLADTWSAWLLELHRVLKPGGILLVTILGPGNEWELGRAWDEDRIGLLVTMPHRDFVGDHGGPIVFHSEWWVREHFGRAFDIEDYWPWGFGIEGPEGMRLGQGCVALRKRAVDITTEELERRADDPREWDALLENLDVVHEREDAWRGLAEARGAELDALRTSRSWRFGQAMSRLAHFKRRKEE
jgi:SAM-dependent methyltransferase